MIVIVGGGAAGFFAAIHSKKSHPESPVIIIEKSKQPLAKVKISGGGRCNVTHACFEPRWLSEKYPRGGKELRGPFTLFQPKDTIEWFESRGVPLKTEADNRIFPQSDSSQSIIDCLTNEARSLGIKLWTQCQIHAISPTQSGFTLRLSNKEALTCKKLILATGSSRDGFELAKRLGHNIEQPIPSLFSFTIKDPGLRALKGISVPTTTLSIPKQKSLKQTGPLLMTHWGISGPAVITLSAWAARHLHSQNYQSPLFIDWLPNYSPETVTITLESQQNKSPKKSISALSPFPEIPNRLWAYFIHKVNINSHTTFAQLSPKQKTAINTILKCDHTHIDGKGPFKEEFVTCGGISLKEINFKTMESNCCPNLHIVGELLNCDGLTGGFNFQNAWTTGYIAGTSP